MSYDIMYDKQFVKLPDNNFIPMILSGCNNLIEYSNSWRGGRGRCSRDWYAHEYVMGHKFFASGEAILKNTQRIIDECVESHANVKKDYETKIYTEDEVKESFGYFLGLAIRTQNTGKCTATMFYNFYKNGIRDAMTIEELDKIGIHVNFNVSDFGYTFSLPIPEWNHSNIISTEQFFKVIKEVEDYKKNCVVTNKDGKKEEVYVHIRFNGSDRMVSDKLKRNRKNSKKKPTGYKDVKVDHFFTLKNHNGYLWKYTANGYKYSYSYPQKHYLTEKEAETFKEYLLRTGKLEAESWNVTKYIQEYTFRIPVYN